MCEPSRRADAADRCRGGDHRGEDKSTPGQECKPTQLTRRAPSGDPPGGDRLTHWQMCLPSVDRQCPCTRDGLLFRWRFSLNRSQRQRRNRCRTRRSWVHLNANLLHRSVRSKSNNGHQTQACGRVCKLERLVSDFRQGVLKKICL